MRLIITVYENKIGVFNVVNYSLVQTLTVGRIRVNYSVEKSRITSKLREMLSRMKRPYSCLKYGRVTSGRVETDKENTNVDKCRIFRVLKETPCKY